MAKPSALLPKNAGAQVACAFRKTVRPGSIPATDPNQSSTPRFRRTRRNDRTNSETTSTSGAAYSPECPATPAPAAYPESTAKSLPALSAGSQGPADPLPFSHPQHWTALPSYEAAHHQNSHQGRPRSPTPHRYIPPECHGLILPPQTLRRWALYCLASHPSYHPTQQ